MRNHTKLSLFVSQIIALGSNYLANIAPHTLSLAGGGCAPSRSSQCSQKWTTRGPRQDVQDHSWCCGMLWVPDGIWWGKVHRVFTHLWLHGLLEEEWTEASTQESECAWSLWGGSSLVPRPHLSWGKWSGEPSRISWAYCQIVVRTNEIAIL